MWLSLKGGCSSPSNVESFVEVSTQPAGPSSRCSVGSNRVGVSLSISTHHSPSARNYDDQPGSLSPTFDDLESFSSSPSMSYLQHATQKEIKNVDQLISMFSSRVPVKQIQTYQLPGENFDDCVECLVNGPTADLLMEVVNKRYQCKSSY